MKTALTDLLASPDRLLSEAKRLAGRQPQDAVAARARPVIDVPQQPREPGRSGLDFPGKQRVHGRAMDPAPAPTPLLPTLIATYLARCVVEGKSPRTVQAYRETLTRAWPCSDAGLETSYGAGQRLVIL